ncbi:Protein of unknown function, partial [Cotesia congregata]
MVTKVKEGPERKEKEKWFNEECKKRRKEVWDKLKKFIKNRSKENKRELKESRKEYKNTMKGCKEKWVEEMCKDISRAKDMSKWWEAINRFRGKKRKHKKNKISEERWETHFDKLLNGEEKEKQKEEEEEENNQVEEERNEEKKTKILICRNGGRKKKEKKWTYEGEEIEVKEVKYVGYWFTVKNSAAKQQMEMARKAQKATNAVCGIIKRSKRNSIRDRMYLMNTVAKSVAMYGVEVWGWEKSEEIRRVHRRLCKMALGVSRDTPGYIWREEMGVEDIEITLKERAVRYIKDVLKMDRERWPWIIMKEEMRGILNGRATKWGKEVKKILEKMGCEEVVRMIYKEQEIEEIET